MREGDTANFYLSGVLTVIGLTAFIGALTAAWFHEKGMMGTAGAICLFSWIGAVLLAKE